MNNYIRYDLGIEQNILGCLLLDNSLIEYTSFIQEDFYELRHYLIYNSIKKLSKVGVVDLVTLSSNLKDKKQLDGIGGNVYLLEITNAVYSTSNFETYKAKLLEYSALRKLLVVSDKLRQDIGDTEDVNELIIETINKVNEAGDKISKRQDTTVDHIESTLNYIESVKDGTVEQFPLGNNFFTLNRAIGGGIEKSKVYRIGGGSNIGKSWLMYNFGLQLLEGGAKIFYATLENKPETTLLNFFAHKKGVNPNKQKIKDAGVDFNDEVLFFSENAERFKIFHGEKNIYNILREAQKFKPDILFLDYIQLARIPGKFNSEKEKLDEYAYLMQDFAIKNNVAIIDLSQMSNSAQGATNNSGHASELKGSGGLKEAADVVIHLYKDNERSQAKECEIENGNYENINKNYIQLRLSKNRDGAQIPALSYTVDFDEGGKYLPL